MSHQSNLDIKTVEGFGEEWTHYDQSNLPEAELVEWFSRYFNLFPFEYLTKESIGADLGCGSGRWAKFIAPRVHKLYCVDASDAALAVAKKILLSKQMLIISRHQLIISPFLKNPWILHILWEFYIIYLTHKVLLKPVFLNLKLALHFLFIYIMHLITSQSGIKEYGKYQII